MNQNHISPHIQRENNLEDESCFDKIFSENRQNGIFLETRQSENLENILESNEPNEIQEINEQINENLENIEVYDEIFENQPIVNDESRIEIYNNRASSLFDKTYKRKFPNQDVEPVTIPTCQDSEPAPDPENGKEIPDSDLPIALRKEKRACAKYPTSAYISYSNLSTSYTTFITNMSSVVVPSSIQEALSQPEWKKAVHEEMEALEKNQTWSIQELPKGKPIVGCKWVFTPKFRSDGTLERYKARLVAKGFTQTFGIDYTETFAPVAKLNTVRILISIVVNLDWTLRQFDVNNDFLNGKLEEEVYMQPPLGFEDRFESRICKLEKALYGLKQSPRAWFERFTQFVKGQDYCQAQSDHTLFTKFSKE